MGALARAGMISGLGQGLQAGLTQLSSYLIQSGLLKERNELEMARDQRRMEFDRGMQQEKIGGEIALAGLHESAATARLERSETGADTRQKQEFAFKQGESAEERRFREEQAAKDRGLKQEELTQRKDLTEKELALKDKALGQDLQMAKDKLAALEKEGKLDRASREKIAALTHDSALKNFELEQRKKAAKLRDELIAAVKAGDEPKIANLAEQVSALEGKPWEERKVDATTAASAMRTLSADIDRLETQLAKAIPGTPEYDRIQRQIDQLRREQGGYSARVQQLTGVKASTGKPYQIVDPLDDLSITKESPEAVRGAINR